MKREGEGHRENGEGVSKEKSEERRDGGLGI